MSVSYENNYELYKSRINDTCIVNSQNENYKESFIRNNNSRIDLL